MIDGIHLRANIENFEEYIENSELNFKKHIEIKSGEISSKAFYNEKGIIINLYPNNRILVNANLPKLLYGNNYTDLSYTELNNAILLICKMLKLTPEVLEISSFEFGLNIPINYTFNSLEMIENVICYKFQSFSDMDAGRKNKSIGKKYTPQEFEIKIYSKSEQLSLCYELVRFETKVRKMNYVSKSRFYNLSSLLNKENLEFLKNKLVENYENTVILDTSIDLNLLNEKEQILYLNWQSPYYRNKLSKTNKRKFHSEKQKLIQLFDKYGKNDLRNSFKKDLIKKWDIQLNT